MLKIIAVFIILAIIVTFSLAYYAAQKKDRY